MKGEILSIASDLREGRMTTNEAKAQLLILFNVVGQSEQLGCGRNITTCVFYKDDSKCSNIDYCRDQTTE